MTNPSLHTVPYDAYVVKLRRWYGDAERPWYWRLGLVPRAYYDEARNRIVTTPTWAQNDYLIAHEYGHALGHEHEPWYRFDVMSPHPPRLFDRHGVLEEYHDWRAGVTEGTG